MYTKDDKIAHIDRVLNSLDAATVDILYRIICGEDHRSSSWKMSISKRLSRHCKERACRD